MKFQIMEEGSRREEGEVVGRCGTEMERRGMWVMKEN